MSMAQKHIERRSSTRVKYSVIAYLEIQDKRRMVQIRDISSTGVLFFSNTPLPLKTPMRLTWKDPRRGKVESSVEVIRTVQGTPNPAFPYCYGSRFIQLEGDGQKNLDHMVKERVSFELKQSQALLDKASFENIQEVIAMGRVEVKNMLKGKESCVGISQFLQRFKAYEIESFEKKDDISQWVQKVSTQYFHCCLLSVLLGNSYHNKLVLELIESKLLAMGILIDECKRFVKSEESSGKTIELSYIRESLKRLVYGHDALSISYERLVSY